MRIHNVTTNNSTLRANSSAASLAQKKEEMFYTIPQDQLPQYPKLNHYDVTFNPTNGASTPILTEKQNVMSDRFNLEEIPDDPVERIPASYVGFATLPDQLHRRAVKKGFAFNLMVVGESGLGKSTFINSLFATELYYNNKIDELKKNEVPSKTVSVRTNKIKLTENLVSLDLALIDTPGFGDALDNSGCWEPIVSFIDQKYEEYLNAETSIQRSLPITDNRVHCCLYFIAPNGHGMRNIDIELMKRLDSKVNIIPIIAKSDTLTSDELKKFKEVIRNDLAREQIKIFDFTECSSNRSERSVGQQKRLAPPLTLSPPFAVVGSNCIIDKDGVLVRGREYPWGFVNVECTDHCDFIPLRKMLIRSHLCDIKEKTHRVHYETYRAKRLSSVASDIGSIPLNERTLLSKVEADHKENNETLSKMTADMEEVFNTKVEEKLRKLEESRVRKTYENYKKAIEEESKRIELKRSEFDKVKNNDLDYVSLR